MASFSVVIPLYNKEQTIERAIRSVLNQTVQDFEIIVVNDGSTDSGLQVVEAIGDTRISVINQENGGVSSARNRGITEATYDLIAFLDADDEWESGFLWTILKLRYKYSQCSVFATRYIIRYQLGKERLAALKGIPDTSWEGILEDYFQLASQSDPPLCSSAVAVTKQAIVSVGGFPRGVAVGEDLLTWARLALRFSIAYSAYPHSIFHWNRPHLDRPKRAPEVPDIVGLELRRLIPTERNRRRKMVQRYVSLWHKMRARVFLELGRTGIARTELVYALRFNMVCPKLWLLLSMTFLPASICKAVLLRAHMRGSGV